MGFEKAVGAILLQYFIFCKWYNFSENNKKMVNVGELSVSAFDLSIKGCAMRRNKISILIPDGESRFALPLLYCLSRNSDVKVNILSGDPWATIRFSRYRAGYHSYIGEPPVDSARKIELIREVVKKTKADIVLPVDQPTIKMLAAHAGAFDGLATVSPLPSVEMFETVADKWLLNGFLVKNNIPAPSTIMYQDDKEFERDILNLRFPVLVKPTGGIGGGEGIKIFTDLSELRLYLEHEEQSQKSVIIQSFINGYDIDCSVLCKNGQILAYTIQKGSMPSNKGTFGPPAGVDFLYHEEVYNVVQQLMKALNWSGIAHVDLRYDEDAKQPRIIEINPRFWVSLLGSLFAGVNFPYLTCLTAMGIDFPMPEYKNIRYMNANARVELLKQRFLHGNNKINPWIGKTRIQYFFKDPLPELYKNLFAPDKS